MSSAVLRPAVPTWGRGLFTAVAVVAIGTPVVMETYEWMTPGGVPIPAGLDGIAMDRPSQDFALPTLEGQSLRLSDLRGKVIFLNFWATWCPPCVEELPSMVALHSALRGYDFEILAVSEDETTEAVRRFFGGILPEFQVVMDDDQKVTRGYGTYKFPETYVIDKDGRVRAKFVGPRSWDTPESIAYFQSLAR